MIWRNTDHWLRSAIKHDGAAGIECLAKVAMDCQVLREKIRKTIKKDHRLTVFPHCYHVAMEQAWCGQVKHFAFSSLIFYLAVQ
jgi:hypothetical protein